MTQIKEVSYLLTNNKNITIDNYTNYEFYPCIRNDKKFSIQLDDRNFEYSYIIIVDKTGNTYFDKNNIVIKYIEDF